MTKRMQALYVMRELALQLGNATAYNLANRLLAIEVATAD